MDASLLVFSDDLRARDLPPGVLDELETMVLNIVDGWYQDTQIDWEDVWDRLDGVELTDGRRIDIPGLASPIQQALKRRVYGR